MAEILRSVEHAVGFVELLVGETILFLDAYGNLADANIYFDNKLNAEMWKDADQDRKKQSLVEATRLIDDLNFNGDKVDADQLHEFPRDEQTSVPRNIEIATYELALRLLEGMNPDYEVENVAAESRGYGGAKTTYNRSFVQEHIAAGIPSMRAWRLLKPYLRDPGTITLSRVQ